MLGRVHEKVTLKYTDATGSYISIGLVEGSTAPSERVFTLDVTSEYGKKIAALFETYYNKPNTNGGQTQTLDITDEEYYVEVTTIVSASSYTVKFNDEEIEASQTALNFSIGNYRYIRKPAYKVANGKLYLALSVLGGEMSNGLLSVSVNGRVYKVRVLEPVNNNLTLVGVSVGGTNATRKGTAEIVSFENGVYTINHTKTHDNIWLIFTYGPTTVAENSYVVTRTEVVATSGTIGYGTDLI